MEEAKEAKKESRINAALTLLEKSQKDLEGDINLGEGIMDRVINREPEPENPENAKPSSAENLTEAIEKLAVWNSKLEKKISSLINRMNKAF